MYRKIKHLTLLILSLFILSGCASIVGNLIGQSAITGLTSDVKYMDGSYPLDSRLGQTSVRFRLLYNWNIFKGERISLRVEVETDESIPKEGSLTFIIDSEIITFNARNKKSITIKKEFPSGVRTWSVIHYNVSKEFINKTLRAEKVLVKIKLDKTYAEADFASENPDGAKSAIRKFMALLRSCTPNHTCR
jgi:hypothetical protein